MHVYSAICRRVSDPSDPIRQRHAYCREQSSRDRQAKTEPSIQIRDEGTRTSPTHSGHADRTKSEDENSPALSVQLHTKDVEALHYGECKANINSTSDDNPTIEQRLSIYGRGEKGKWKHTLLIDNRKYHVPNAEGVRPRTDANCPSLSMPNAFVKISAIWRFVLTCSRLISPA